MVHPFNHRKKKFIRVRDICFTEPYIEVKNIIPVIQELPKLEYVEPVKTNLSVLGTELGDGNMSEYRKGQPMRHISYKTYDILKQTPILEKPKQNIFSRIFGKLKFW